MKKTLAVMAVSLLLGTAGSASAQMAGPAFNWTGFYVGADLGWHEVKDRSTVPASTPYCWWDCKSYGESGSSFIAGLHTGYNWQSDAIVFGVEGDVAGMNSASTVNDFCSSTYCDYTQKVKMNALATLRGRVGYDLGGILPFVTGGLAVGNVRNYVADNNDEGLWDKTQFRTGYIFGGGFEYAMDENCLIRLQADYFDLGSTTFISKSILAVDGDSLPVKFHNDGYMVTVGFSYKLTD